ncbi:MAG: polyprenol monophosphomannose synthase [Anaerolineae bacterium]
MPDQPRAFLVLPTYNERDNLPLIVAALRALPISLHILIVDDHSPDGTGAVADELATTYPKVQVIHRPGKLGLGTAYTAGFQVALAQGAELILTMDADFSHDPRYVPALVEASQRFDLVIGSRYIPGGGVRHWGLQRRALSRGANAIAHRVLGLRTRDCTAGFRCYRRTVLEAINPATIRADGYSYLIELLFRCERAGFNVGEVPIIFVDRRLGRSKISQHEIFKAAFTVLRLSYRRLRDRSR